MTKRISLSLQRNNFEYLLRELKDTQSDYGRSLKDFRIICELGRGSYGIAYKVEALLDRRCIYVLKKIPIRHVKPKYQRDTLQEVLILRKMTHPYIIRYYTSFIEEDCLYILMEYAAGGDLHKLIRNHQENGKYFSEMQIWRFAFQIGLGLEYLHSQKIIHRDIKCLNIFLTENNTIKIGDLGVSRILSNAKLLRGSHVGTPLYLSPELIQQKPYDYKIDIWAMGIVLYYLAALEPPFKGENLTTLAKTIVNDVPKALSRGYSSTLQHYINRLLAKRATERPNTKEMLKMIPVLVKKELYGKPHTEKIEDNVIEKNSGDSLIRPLEDRNIVKLIHVASQKKIVSEDEKIHSQNQPIFERKESNIVLSNVSPIKREEQQASVHPEITKIHPEIPNIHPEIPNIHPEISNIHPEISNIHPEIPNIHPEIVQLFHKRNPENNNEECKSQAKSLSSVRQNTPSISFNLRRKRIIINSSYRAESASQKSRPTLSALLKKNSADIGPCSNLQHSQEDPSRPSTANFPAFFIIQNEPRLSSASQMSRPKSYLFLKIQFSILQKCKDFFGAALQTRKKQYKYLYLKEENKNLNNKKRDPYKSINLNQTENQNNFHKKNIILVFLKRGKPQLSYIIIRPRYNKEEVISSREELRPNTAFSLCSQQGQVLPKISNIIPHINHFGSTHGEMKPILFSSKSTMNYMTLREPNREQRYCPQHPSIIERKNIVSVLRPGQKKLTVTDLS